ncbi:MAG: hypothetical protein MJ054_00370 [Clostridia bacterium]|nr:hypothetical protein [Clostridia bacterium]
MYWGNSLLAFGIENLWEGLSEFLYVWVWNLIPTLLYDIWRLLAFLVNAIEGIFRNLAGISASPGKDMTSVIINSGQVQTIFGNLVGLSMAIIIFFTIVKIIQEHYKEKDGGNPYKIVLRTFKGLLMFFFVSAAVTVGLQATGVMFRALDASTGSGSTSIAGQVFQAMAYDANRKRIEEPSGIGKRYKGRLDDSSYDNGRYFMTEISDESKIGTQGLSAKYAEIFPVYQYGIVNNDGTVTPLSKYLQTMDGFDATVDEWNNMMSKKPIANPNRDGSLGGTVGFQSDLLRGVDLKITPRIDLTWSPIDIDRYSYSLMQSNKIEHNVQVTVLGNGVLIPMSTQLLKFGQPTVVHKSLEESAKVFGISMSGSVSLQNSKASASFSLEQGDLFSKKYGEILQNIITNVLYTNMMQYLVQMVPAFPGEISIGPVAINLVQLLAPLVTSIIKDVTDNTFAEMVTSTDEKNGKEYTTAELYSNNTSSHSAGVWVTQNPNSKFLETTIEQYRIDGNFTDLWGQLMKNYNKFINQLQVDSSTAYQKINEGCDKISNRSDRIIEQRVWQEYKAKVDNYNERASRYLNNLGNMLALWTIAQGISDKDDFIAGKGYGGSWHKLTSDIESEFTNLVRCYNSMVFNQKPTNCYADAIITVPVYKPIVEFHMTDSAASALSVEEIFDSLVLGKKNKTGKIDVNLQIVTGSTNKAYRMVDWPAYGPLYRGNFSDDNGTSYNFEHFTDLYYPKNISSGMPSAILSNNSPEGLGFMNLEETSKDNWQQFGGIRFLATQGDNDFKNHADSMDTLLAEGYWSSNGVYVSSFGKPVYYYYEGTSFLPIDGVVNGAYPLGTTSTANNIVRVSTANEKSLLLEAQGNQNQMFNDVLQVDTTTEYANEFSKNIIRLRKLGPQDDGENVPVMKDWIEEQNMIYLNGNHREYMLHTMTADDIDDIMSSTTRSGRRYLMITEGANDANGGDYFYGDYVGIFTWNDLDTVTALYSMWKINYAIGFIAIIAAVGVYMNFAFGLIQRAINMAVLYVMSPVTIAFYPFDDGAKFNNNFVKPFYNEAISAFAVIISLNLFVVLLNPLHNAVKTALGEGMVGWIASWLGLVAFVSMLPQIRDSISSILGGGKLAQKSLTDTIKGFSGTMKQPLGEMKNLGKSTAHGLAKIRTAKDSAAGLKKVFDAKQMEYLSGRQAEGKLGFFGERRLNKLSGGSSAAATQKRIDDARSALKEADKETDEKKAAEMRKKALGSLSSNEIHRMKLQDKAAEKKAKSTIKRDIYGSDSAGEEAYKKAINNEKSKLLSDDKFKKSVNGVVSKTFNAFDTVGGGLGKAKNATKNNLKVATSFVADSIANSGVGFAFRRSALGAAVHNKFGINGQLAQNKDSIFGEVSKWFNPVAREKTMNESYQKYRADEYAQKSHEKDVMAGLTVFKNKMIESDEEINEAAKSAAALNIVGQNSDTGLKFKDLLASQYIQQGMSMSDARSTAETKYNELAKSDSFDVNTEYAKLGGDAKYAMGLAKGWKELSLKLDEDSINEAEKSIQGKVSLGSDGISSNLKKLKEARSGQINEYVDLIAKHLNIGDDKKKDISSILNNVKRADSFSDIAKSISEKLGLEQAGVESAMSNNYGNFASNVQFNAEIEQLELAQAAVKARAKAKETFEGKIGNLVSEEEKKSIEAIFENVYDASINSTNPDSFGSKKREIIEKYENQGGINNIDCQKEIDNLLVQMKAKATEEYNKIVKRNSRATREFNVAKKAAEEMSAVDASIIMDEIQHQREFHMSTNMDFYSNELLIKDSHLQELHKQGRYVEAGDELQLLINAVRQHDEELIKSLGFDENTVNTLKLWESNGNEKRLDGIFGLGAFDAAHMGSLSSAMGGSTLLGMESALAQLTQVSELNTLVNKMKATVDNYAKEEGSARTTVSHVISKISTAFAGEEWTGKLNGIKDANGNLVKNSEQLVAALKKTVDDVNNGKNLAYIDENLKILANFKAENINRPEMREFISTIDMFQNGISQAKFANQRVSEMAITNKKISDYLAELTEIINKIKPFSGSK